MLPKCFVSHKSIDRRYRQEITDMGVNTAANIYDSSADYDDEGIVTKLRNGSLAGTTVTIYLIGTHSAENLGMDHQIFIKRELQASGLPSQDGLPNAIIGVVLPDAYGRLFGGGTVKINDHTVVREFSRTYCAGRCCSLVRWDDFASDPIRYVKEANAARSAVSG